MFVLKSNDGLAIKTFAETFKSVLDYNQGILRKKDTFDILDEELIKPINGTALPEVDDVGNILEHFGSGGDLIQIDGESDDDDSTENTSSGGVPSLYWSPKGGDISILSNETAAAVANLTDCMICKEPESRRVRLINGNICVALEKLQRLEALLVSLARRGIGCIANLFTLAGKACKPPSRTRLEPRCQFAFSVFPNPRNGCTLCPNYTISAF